MKRLWPLLLLTALLGAGSPRESAFAKEDGGALPSVATFPGPDASWAAPHLDGETLLGRPEIARAWRRIDRGLRTREGRLVDVVGLVRRNAADTEVELEDWVDPATGRIVGGRRITTPEQGAEEEATPCGAFR
jgi:hypothetical protein